MPRGQDLPESMRGGVLALFLFAGMGWNEISSTMKINPDTARIICERVKTHINDSAEQIPPSSETEGVPYERIRALFAAVENHRAQSCGRKEKIPEGSAVAEILRDGILCDAEHQDMPWWTVAKELGLDSIACRATIEKVVHKYLDIHRYIPRLKPPLSEENMGERVGFAIWALAKLDGGAIFIFTDETWVEIGGVRRQRRVSRPKGANPYDYSRPKKKITLRIMFWGAIAAGYKGPSYIWAKETAEEKKLNDKIVADMVKQDEEAVARHRERALIAGTEEFKILREIHRKIVNGPRTATGRQPPRPPPQWVWKKQKIERQSTAGGIDWVRYREKILYDRLYPFLKKIQSENPGKEIWLVEDNAPSHKGATSRDPRWVEEMEPLGIYKCIWPSNSPDINEIEPLWDDFKDSIEAEGPFTGASKETVARVKMALNKCWSELSEEGIKNRCDDFRYKLELVVRNAGKNNFNG